MKEAPGEGRKTIINEAVEMFTKALASGSSPSDAEHLQDHNTTKLDENQRLSPGTSSIPLFPDFPYLNIPPGDNEPLTQPPAYSETDNLRVYTGPFEATTAVTQPALASPPPYSPPHSPLPSTDAFLINAVPVIIIYPPSSSPSPSTAAPPINPLSLSPMSSLSSPPIPPPPSTVPSVPSKKTKGKKGKKGKKKEKAERKASKMAAATAATTPVGPSTDEGLDQPPTPSSTSTVINTPVTGEMSSSSSARQTPLTFEVCDDSPAYIIHPLY